MVSYKQQKIKNYFYPQPQQQQVIQKSIEQVSISTSLVSL